MKAEEGLGQSLPFLQPLASCIQPPEPNREASIRNAANPSPINESRDSNREKPGIFRAPKRAKNKTGSLAAPRFGSLCPGRASMTLLAGFAPQKRCGKHGQNAT